ncbi:MAG: sugar phosphate nucleotidyltransferase [Candidatus Krumholzibacteriia bacterium]
MKAVIPAAGVGTRLRPHTLTRPKALLPVAGKPILAHIVDDLAAAGVDGFVLIVGYKGDAVREWFARERPDLDITFVQQERRLGLGHAVWTAREALGDEPFFCILGDTILKADYAQLLRAPTNLIGVREVDDPRRFGVVEMDGERVRRFVEKPDVPPSNLAIVGAYFFRDAAALWAALGRVVAEDIRTRGEYQLTDGLQLMIEAGCAFATVPVSEWYDCGKAETWLDTNRVLLARAAAGRDAARPGVVAPCHLAPDVVVEDSRIGPDVSVGAGTVIRGCELRDCVIGEHSRLEDCRLAGSLVGDHCVLRGASGSVNVGDYSEIDAS